MLTYAALGHFSKETNKSEVSSSKTENRLLIGTVAFICSLFNGADWMLILFHVDTFDH